MDQTMSGERSSYEKGTGGDNGTHIQGKKMEGTNSPQIIEKNFPFLKLPAEIRNAIYRLALLTQNVSTDTMSGSTCSRTLGQASNAITSVQTVEEEVGTIRCEPWQTYAIEYQVSLLRVNQQIQSEACGIFQLENFWTIVRVNKEGFGKEMKVRGFPVWTGADEWRHIRFPVMKMTVTFPSLEGQSHTDFFFLATVHLDDLMRALWTAKGASEMEVLIHLQRPLTNHSPSQRDLLQPFCKLRNIKRTAAWSEPRQRYVDLVSRALTTTEDIELTYSELESSNKCLREHIKAGQWRQAVSYMEEHVILMSDCKIVYGNSFIGIEPDLTPLTTLTRGVRAKNILVGSAVNSADVSYHECLYSHSVLFAEHALSISEMSNFPYLNPLGITVIPSRQQCLILLIRARAYIRMEQAEAAFDDMARVREFRPDSRTLAFVSQMWEDKFGPLPNDDDL